MPLVVIETAGALSNIQVLFCDQVGGPDYFVGAEPPGRDRGVHQAGHWDSQLKLRLWRILA